MRRFDDLIRRPHLWWIAAAAFVALALWGPTAMAQNNSLLGGARRGLPAPGANPTSQPANPNAAPALLGAATNARATLHADRPELKPNAVLLRWSPLAVKSPDPEKIKTHDLITIIIRESKTATTNSKMESNKDWKLDSSLSKWIRLSDKHGIVPAKFEEGNPAAAFDFKNDYTGDGKYDRKDELTTRITAQVIDVKPNGNLVLEATKEITIDDEGYTIKLTGECRSKDVTPDNTVLSTQIGSPIIDVQHTGAVRDATRRGWLMRALDLFHPF
jgi:flagellar L-ring protein FlgH